MNENQIVIYEKKSNMHFLHITIKHRAHVQLMHIWYNKDYR